MNALYSAFFVINTLNPTSGVPTGAQEMQIVTAVTSEAECKSILNWRAPTLIAEYKQKNVNVSLTPGCIFVPLPGALGLADALKNARAVLDNVEKTYAKVGPEIEYKMSEAVNESIQQIQMASEGVK